MITEEASKRITVLRFPLISLVVLIHSTSQVFGFLSKDFVFLRFLIGEIITSVAVPMFFVISGYLLFINETFDYKDLLRQKIRSLLLPYILWNTFTLIAFWLFRKVPNIQDWFNEEWMRIECFTYSDFVRAFIGRNVNFGYKTTMPIAGQLWYIRELFIVSILFPLIKYLLKRFPLFFLSASMILYLHPIFFSYLFYKSLFFVSCGIFAAMKASFIEENSNRISLKDLVITYLFLSFFMVYLHSVHSKNFFYIVKQIFVLCSCLICIKFSAYLISRNKILKTLKFLSSYSYWIFLSHSPILLIFVYKFLNWFFPSNTHVLLFFFYSFHFLISLSVTLIIGIGLNKLSPSFFNFITGKRIKRKHDKKVHKILFTF